MRRMSIAVCLLLTATTAFAQKHASSVSKVTFMGTRPLTPGSSLGTLPPGFLISEGLDTDVGFDIPGVSGNNSPARTRAAGVPTTAGTPISTGVFFSLPGLTQFDQATAFTGSATGFNGQLEPPDQGLAVGNGLVVEAINNAIQFYLTNGTPILPFAIAMNVLYDVAPTFTLDPNTGKPVSFGPSLSDPRVYYDAKHGFFLVTETETDVNPATGASGTASHIFIAVIPNNLSTITVFSLDVTNDGDAAFGACPCFGDQPLIGADANGFYVSTNAFNTAQRTFRGAQIYALSLSALETASSGSIAAVRFGDLTQDGEPGFSIQPATIPPGGVFEAGQNGTEYLVSTFHNVLDNRLTVWALTDTASLKTTPTLTLVNTVIDSESYGVPPATDQESGPTPLRDLIASRQSPLGTFKNHLELIADNDDRLQQVMFAAGSLWTAVPTVVKTPHGPVRAGAAWFILTPSIGTAEVGAWVLNQGYISIDSPHQDSLLFPAVGVNAAGKGAIAFSMAGDDFFPSVGYALLDAATGAGPIVISGPGVAPDDGFSGYAPFATRGAARWGDYSAAVSDEFGNIWMGGEMIPRNPPVTGILAANWGTFITSVAP